MTWFRLDGEFAENPKVMDLSDRAFRLHVSALCHTTRNLTDGILSPRAVKVVCALTSSQRRHIVELRDAGLWIERDDDYEINGYLDYNPDAETLKELRDKRREAGRKGGIASGASRQKKAKPKASAKANAEANASRSASNHITLEEQEPSVSYETAPEPVVDEGGGGELVPLATQNTQTLLAEFVQQARRVDVEIPGRVKGHLASEIKRLLDEGQAPAAVWAGLARMVERRVVQPSLLPNFVVEAQLPSRSSSGQRYGRGVTTEQILEMARVAREREAS